MAMKSDPNYTLKGCITNLQDEPLQDLTVRAYDQDPNTPDNPLGKETITDAEGRYTIDFTEKDFKIGGVESGGPDVFIRVYGEGDNLGESEVRRNAKKQITINLKVDFVAADEKTKRKLDGHITLEHGLPARELELRLYCYAFGGTAIRIGETITDEKGDYTLTYKLRNPAARLEVRAVDAEGKEIALSKPLNQRIDKSPNKLNLIAPGTLQPLAAEYLRLTNDLKPHVGEMRNLANVKEDAKIQDLTVLNRTTGWDARLIALAATTERLSADADVKLPQEAIYGLLRAGLPSDKLMLAQVSADVAEQALKTVRDAGIVELTDQQIGQFKQQFATFSNKVRLAVPAPGSRSTYGELLKASRLSDDAQAKFAAVYLSHRGDAAQLWENARQAGLDDMQIGKLQLQGKLAFLAGNSEWMTARLMQKQINDPVQLVEQDFHRADAWVNEVYDLAGIPVNLRDNLTDAHKKKLDAVIPAAYAGDKVEDRLDAYAEDMARKVRLSYPTQVVGRMIEQDNTDAFKLGAARAGTATLLKSAAGQGFRLGQTPVAAFLKTHVGVAAGMADNEFQAAQQQMKTLQRVYQITPSNAAMPVLMSLGMSSAYDVMAYSEEAFAELYNAKYQELYGKVSTQAEARLVRRKAEQVSSVTYNLFTIAKKLDSEAPVYGIAASAEVRESVRNELIKQFPTMESLFGSMDFCECEHCRSVLSPAAYLVDLLQFVDPAPEEGWDGFLALWKKNHGGHAYTGEYTLNGQQFTGKYKKPYDALVERRPDLPHIPLTCENTHTALPYIDIVNEILEYYVANEELTEDAAHDTGEATTAELLAEPQNVIREAYDKLREARYPLNLPFDLWIETVRQFCNYFETPLARVLEVFRPSDDLFAATQPFDHSSIFIESLGLSLAETAIFTDPDPLGNDKWHELYGYPRVRPAIQNPTNAEHATLTIANADAEKFRKGIACTYFDVSANVLNAETKTISAVGAPDSGGAGLTIITLRGVWNAPPDAGDHLVCDALATLKSAKALSRRLSVTYKEIVEIVQTGFVNPKLNELIILYKLGVTIQDVTFYKEHRTFYEQNKDLVGKARSELSAADQQRFDEFSLRDETTKMTGLEILSEVDGFEQRIKSANKDLEAFGFDASAWLNTALQNKAFDDILVLADPDAGCNFDLTTLRYANGDPADAIVFLKINLFVRLWRKLGWSIEETDRALQAFVPKNTPFETAHLDKQPLQTALIYLAHLKALDEKVRVGKQSRLKLITLWSDLATTGKKPLYAQLFLTRSVLKSDDVFNHPLGRYLSATGVAAMAQSRWHRVQLENVALADKIDPAPFAGEPKVELSYDELQEVQHLAFEGILSDAEKAALIALSPSPALPKLLDAVQVKAKEFTLVKGHLLALQGSLGLTADEIGRILEDADKSLDTAELSLPNVSLLYRYGLLAKALKLPVRELIALKQLSGLNPFKILHPAPLTTLAEDYPFSQTLRFVEVAEEVKESGLKIEDLEYLLRHRFDETGKYRPKREGTLALLKTLAEGVRAIRTEHAVPDDPGAMSEEMLRQKLGLALPPDVVEPFLAMMNGTVEFTASKTGVPPVDELKLETFTDESLIRQVSYKEVPHKEQKLTLRGVLFAAQKTELETRFNAALTATQKPVFAELLSSVQDKAKEFFEKHLQKQAPNVQPAAGFLDAADFDLLFDRNLALAAGETEQDRVRNRRTKLANAFLPFLQERLIRQFIVQTMTAHMGADPVLVESLLTDERLLAGPKPVLDAFAATAERGLTATFFASVDGTGAALPTVSLADANTGLKDKDGNPLKPAGANSARLEGYLEVPAPGAYRFYVALDKQTAEAELRFAHLVKPTLTGAANNDGDEVGDGPREYAELKPGIPYRFTLDLRKLNGGEARLLVQGETLPKDRLAQLALYPLTAMEGAERAVLLLTKALQLLQSLGLSEREIRYLLTGGAHAFDNLDFDTLPWRDAQQALEAIANKKREANPNLTKEQAMVQARNENPDLATEADQATPLFEQFLRLAGYARLKRDLASGTDDLIDVLEANGTDDLDRLDTKVYPLIAKLTGRGEATVKGTAKALWGQPAFASEKPLQRLWEALQVVERFGVPVASLLEWTRIVSPAATPEQRFEIARGLKEAIKARFEPETWQRVAQPIFDKLRQRQRDALVAHVMSQHGFARMEQLYEYFLIDPGMEPVVQTSRIRLAIASVQLFIQRCLLNMEPQVHPSVINSKQWEWMKRYRVWEANRKIFLFPENWLEPEFRDDKTHLFSELEGALLQGDVSSDLVEDAFLNYLKKLDELARLDIVAMHLEDKVDPAQNTLHVIGRTYSQPHKYFYRRYAHQMWTPWEPVSAEIEGDHLAPVVWRDRLYLFWVTFMDKPVENPQPTGATATTKLTDLTLSSAVSGMQAMVANKTVEVQLHWSEYLQGKWSTRESGEFTPVTEKRSLRSYSSATVAAGVIAPIESPGSIIVDGFLWVKVTVPLNFDPRSVFIHVSKEYEGGEERGVYIHLSGKVNQAFYLAGRNSGPERADSRPKPNSPYGLSTVRATRYSGSGALTVEFKQRITTEPGREPNVETPRILQRGGGYTLLPCDNDIETLDVSEDAYQNADDPAAVKAAIERGLGEITSLMKPAFYQDNAHTLFVEPNVTERTIEEWQEWVTRTPQPEPGWRISDWWKDIVVIPEIPWKGPIPDPVDPWVDPIDPGSLINPVPGFDWLVNPATGLLFDGVLIGPTGRPGIEILTTDAAGAVAVGGTVVNVNPGSGLASGSIVVLTGATILEETGLTQAAGGLNVVGGAGFNSALAQNFSKLNRSGLGANMPGAGRVGR